MSDFKAKMHQIRFWLGLRPRLRWGSLQRSHRPSSWWGEGLLPVQRTPLRSRPFGLRTSVLRALTPLSRIILSQPWLVCIWQWDDIDEYCFSCVKKHSVTSSQGVKCYHYFCKFEQNKDWLIDWLIEYKVTSAAAAAAAAAGGYAVISWSQLNSNVVHVTSMTHVITYSSHL